MVRSLTATCRFASDGWPVSLRGMAHCITDACLMLGLLTLATHTATGSGVTLELTQPTIRSVINQPYLYLEGGITCWAYRPLLTQYRSRPADLVSPVLPQPRLIGLSLSRVIPAGMICGLYVMRVNVASVGGLPTIEQLTGPRVIPASPEALGLRLISPSYVKLV